MGCRHYDVWGNTARIKPIGASLCCDGLGASLCWPATLDNDKEKDEDGLAIC